MVSQTADINIFEMQANESIQYMGCYEDGPNRDFAHKFWNVISTQQCKDKAIMGGYKYFALQVGEQCFGSNTPPNQGLYNPSGNSPTPVKGSARIEEHPRGRVNVYDGVEWKTITKAWFAANQIGASMICK